MMLSDVECSGKIWLHLTSLTMAAIMAESGLFWFFVPAGPGLVELVGLPGMPGMPGLAGLAWLGEAGLAGHR